MTAPDYYAELQTQLARTSEARCALAFIRGVMDTCNRFKQPLTPVLVMAMLKAADEVLEPQPEPTDRSAA